MHTENEVMSACSCTQKRTRPSTGTALSSVRSLFLLRQFRLHTGDKIMPVFGLVYERTRTHTNDKAISVCMQPGLHMTLGKVMLRKNTSSEATSCKAILLEASFEANLN